MLCITITDEARAAFRTLLDAEGAESRLRIREFKIGSG